MDKLTLIVSLVLLVIGVESQTTCVTDGDCGENYRCYNKLCSCPSNYYENTNPRNCVPYAGAPGDTCTYNEQCKNLVSISDVKAICDKGYCVCDLNSHVNGTKCYRNRRLTDTCLSNEECSFNNPGGVCTGSICTCTFGFLPHPTNGSYCVKAALYPGDSCTDSNDCSIFMTANSICENSTCSCRAGYHFGKQIGRCLANKRLGDSCTTAEECYIEDDGNQQRVNCTRNLCTCIGNYRPNADSTRCNNDGSSLVPFLVLIITSLFSLHL